jgi:hypothetical protein
MVNRRLRVRGMGRFKAQAASPSGPINSGSNKSVATKHHSARNSKLGKDFF